VSLSLSNEERDGDAKGQELVPWPIPVSKGKRLARYGLKTLAILFVAADFEVAHAALYKSLTTGDDLRKYICSAHSIVSARTNLATLDASFLISVAT
jgi:hypothetical protein